MLKCELSIKNRLRHYINPIHIYCRLRDLGVNKKWAMKIVNKWETVYAGGN